MNTTARAASLDDCLTLARVDRSQSRARQLSWVASEMTLFAETLPVRERPRSAADWLEAGFVSRYLAAADAGTLRRRGGEVRPSTDATRRVRRACLRLLAEAAALPDPVGDQVDLPAVRPHVDAPVAKRAVSHWRYRALPVDASPGDVRTAAMAVLIHEAGMRTGELAALVPGDLDLASGTVTYQPRPPSTRNLPPPCTISLTPAAVTVLRHWIEVRAVLTAKTPRSRSLWVSLAPNHNGTGVRRPAGMPLQPTGLRRAYSRAVASLNFELAGTPGFAPLPRSAGRLRPGAQADAPPA